MAFDADKEYADFLARVNAPVEKAGGLATTIERDKRAMLAAAASAGKAGLDAYNRARAGLEADRQAAIGRAQARAALVGGPEAQGFETLANEQYGRGLGNLESAQSAALANLSARTQANTDYFDKVAAAVPATRSYVAGTLARQASRGRSSGSGGGGGALSDSELRTRLIGAGRQQLEHEQAYIPPAYREQEMLPVAGPTLTGKPLPSIPNPTYGKTAEALARDLGVRAGIDRNRVYGLIEDVKAPKPPSSPELKSAATKAKVSEADYNMIKAKAAGPHAWQTLVDKAYALLNAGASREQYLASIRADLFGGSAKLDRTFRMLEAEMAPIFPTAAELKRLAG